LQKSAADLKRPLKLMRWIGVDVGGQKKGFDVAGIDGTGLVLLRGVLTCPTEGLTLYAALESVAADVIEVFLTASWTRWLGKKGRALRGFEAFE
jgi:hypothetical protein